LIVQVTKLAEKGAAVTALALGGVLLLAGMLDKVSAVRSAVGATEAPAEFVAILLTGTLLVLIGVAAELYYYKTATQVVLRNNEIEYGLSKQAELSELIAELDYQRRQRPRTKLAGPLPAPGASNRSGGSVSRRA
jgi:hypothetical protein